MRRKILQDFANVLCQRFIDLPNGHDLAAFVHLGSGSYTLDILSGNCTRDGLPIPSLRMCNEYREWLLEQQTKHGVPPGILGVSMRITVSISDERTKTSYGHVFPSAHFEFDCHSEIQTDEKIYSGHKHGSKTWGLPSSRVEQDQDPQTH
jgi:hypothetical protein